ncbi:hypothetical protein FJ420_01990 [Mesorhizobium sp. B3-1-3]|uniref:hypothetical protein n=1 Tax=unclassified Mesorhizobium TaxID=325217 RepID=UPI001129C405|nr:MULTISPECIES: hypothetical protein [unclassified Mesorhizobium]TPI67601.1 hypothetical protein FJ424_09960 [Mesorhizobium sp. B3-1-8]TPI75647.1 hypothetical protein FJ420_01990 [Mesorhizobium sp. B3-1-3]
MARYAVLIGNVVENIIEAVPGFTIPGRALVPATANPQIGFVYSEGTFQAPAGPTVEELREAMPQITPRQLRLTLLTLGIHEADVDIKLVNDPAGMVEWKYATYFKRTHPLVDSLGALFSINAEQIDSLWAWATEL